MIVQKTPDISVIVVNYFSEPEPARCPRPTGRNAGFLAACNTGASPRLLLLNPDAVVPQGALGEVQRAQDSPVFANAIAGCATRDGGAR